MKKMRKLIRRLVTKDTIFVIVVLVVSACLFLFIDPKKPEEVTVTARITQLEDNTDILAGWMKVGGQEITARILSGPYRGQDITVLNSLTGNLLLDRYVKVGNRVILTLDIENGKIRGAELVDYDRQSWYLIMLAIFAGLLILFARYTGVKAFVSFIFTAVVLIKIGIPSILGGYDPLFILVFFAILFGTVTLLLVGGFSIRALSAIIGLTIGIILSGGLVVLAGEGMRMYGIVSEMTMTLLFSGYSHLNMDKIFWGAVILGASGAMVDIAISVATSVREVVKANPSLSAWRLIHSGFEVGRAALGTMVTTLLLAYFGCSFFLFLVFTAKMTQLMRILNYSYISAEILRTLAGSIGMVMIAPITAVIAGLLYHRAYGSERRRELTSETGGAVDEGK
ncbi:YibE/F family protein [Patescibacteria group bacterium]|nr:YibE/F family protein [Patescibacteria group bacterium]